MKYWTVVIRHSMYGDTTISGEFLDEQVARTWARGAETVHDMLGGNGRFEKVVVVEHADETLVAP